MQWIDYMFKGIALVLGYSLRQAKATNQSPVERKREIERAADQRARVKFDSQQ